MNKKLVRDKIPKIITQGGKTPITHTADNEEYWEKLKEKLLEETNEFIEEENNEELADIIEVINAICAHKSISISQIEKLRKQKSEERGGFKDKIILDRIE